MNSLGAAFDIVAAIAAIDWLHTNSVIDDIARSVRSASSPRRSHRSWLALADECRRPPRGRSLAAVLMRGLAGATPSRREQAERPDAPSIFGASIAPVSGLAVGVSRRNDPDSFPDDPVDQQVGKTPDQQPAMLVVHLWPAAGIVSDPRERQFHLGGEPRCDLPTAPCVPAGCLQQFQGRVRMEDDFSRHWCAASYLHAPRTTGPATPSQRRHPAFGGRSQQPTPLPSPAPHHRQPSTTVPRPNGVGPPLAAFALHRAVCRDSWTLAPAYHGSKAAPRRPAGPCPLSPARWCSSVLPGARDGRGNANGCRAAVRTEVAFP